MKGCNINQYLVIKTQVNYIATQCLDAAFVFRILLQLGGKVMMLKYAHSLFSCL